jgi:hypothetical protein
MQAQGDVESGARASLAALRTPRGQWVDAFSSTLLELNPHWGLERTQRMACELWPELSHFDPVIAAELEHESALCDA